MVWTSPTLQPYCPQFAQPDFMTNQTGLLSGPPRMSCTISLQAFGHPTHHLEWHVFLSLWYKPHPALPGKLHIDGNLLEGNLAEDSKSFQNILIL